MIKKFSHTIYPAFDEFPMFDDEQVRRSRLIAAHVLAIKEDGDISFIEREAPWFLPGITGAHAHLRRHGFEYGYRVIGKANSVAHRVAAYTSPSRGGFDMGCAAVAIAWHHKGAGGRDWFFHLAFRIGFGTEVNPYEVAFQNALDKNYSHFTRETIVLAPA